MGVEYGKKENRSEPGFALTMREFLKVRGTTDPVHNTPLSTCRDTRLRTFTWSVICPRK